MKFYPKAASYSWIALYAVLGVSVSTQAQAFFTLDPRPPPNGANGTSLNGITVNGLSANGLSLNGLDADGSLSQGLKVQGGTLPNGEQVKLR